MKDKWMPKWIFIIAYQINFLSVWKILNMAFNAQLKNLLKCL